MMESVSNWPAAIVGVSIAIGFFSWMIGKWPWEGIIDRSTHNYYGEDEEETDD